VIFKLIWTLKKWIYHIAKKLQMTVLFISLIAAITITSLFVPAINSISLELGAQFELSQSMGPVYLQYDPKQPFSEFLRKSNMNCLYWYIDGRWTLDGPIDPRPFNPLGCQLNIVGRVFINENSTIDLYTNNYSYPLLKNQSLPLNKTFFGNFNPPGDCITSSQQNYLKWLGRVS
jgi:hypothetical protein